MIHCNQVVEPILYDKMLEDPSDKQKMTDMMTPETADQDTRMLLDMCLHLETITFMLPPDKQAVTASNTPR